MIKIYITEDHELYLEGLMLLLSRQPDLVVVGTSMDGKSLLENLNGLEADLLLLDIQLPDMQPEELVRSVRQARPDLKIIFLTLMRGTRFIHRLLKFDIQGYLLKSARLDELQEAIRTVASGGTYFSKEIDITQKEDDFRNTVTIDERRINDILTKREIEILKLVCLEYSNARIAEQLFLSIGTVETHRKNLIAKLGVNNTVGLVKFAVKNGLVD
jgi:two-component system response regulator NreC